MTIAATLKDKWNRAQCWLDGENINLFASTAVDNEMAKAGWKTERTVMTPVVIAGGLTAHCPILTTAHDPKGRKVETAEQRREYSAARHAAAKTVYGLN